MSTDQASSNLYKEVYGSGDPILCLHGMGASTFSWRHFIAPFSQNNKLILVDFKGCGKSPKPMTRIIPSKKKLTIFTISLLTRI